MACKLLKGVVSSPVGNWDFIYCELGLHFVKLTKDVTNDNFIEKGKSEVELQNNNNDSGDKIVGSFHRWMRDYFGNNDKENGGPAPVKVCPSVFGLSDDGMKQSFKQKVWQTLYEEVAYGKTVSYSELASLSGSPGASRAVGTAMATNPVSLVVPCHRVITAQGRAGHYAGKKKDDVKVWLLKHEGAM